MPEDEKYKSFSTPKARRIPLTNVQISCRDVGLTGIPLICFPRFDPFLCLWFVSETCAHNGIEQYMRSPHGPLKTREHENKTIS